MGVGAEIGIQLNNYLGINAGYKMFGPLAYQQYNNYMDYSHSEGDDYSDLPNGDAWLTSYCLRKCNYFCNR